MGMLSRRRSYSRLRLSFDSAFAEQKQGGRVGAHFKVCAAEGLVLSHVEVELEDIMFPIPQPMQVRLTQSTNSSAHIPHSSINIPGADQDLRRNSTDPAEVGFVVRRLLRGRACAYVLRWRPSWRRWRRRFLLFLNRCGRDGKGAEAMGGGCRAVLVERR